MSIINKYSLFLKSIVDLLKLLQSLQSGYWQAYVTIWNFRFAGINPNQRAMA